MERATASWVLFTCIFLAAAPIPATAQEWIPLDARSRATGSAGVAMADGPEAAYWNPASLAEGAEMPLDFSTGWGLKVSAEFRFELLGNLGADLVELANLYQDLNIDDIRTRIETNTHSVQDIQDIISLFDSVVSLDDPSGGILIGAGAGTELTVGPFSVFARGFGTAGIDPSFDGLAPNGFLTTQNLNDFFSGFNDDPMLSAAGMALSASLAAAGLGADDNDSDLRLDADELAYQAQLAIGDVGISDPGFIQLMETIVTATTSGGGSSDPDDIFSLDGVALEIRNVNQAEAGYSGPGNLYRALSSICR